MEAAVYRKNADHVGTTKDESATNVLEVACETPSLSPELFYPHVTEEEMVTWTHWLPTSLKFYRNPSSDDVTLMLLNRILTAREAPAAVIEEFQWSWEVDLFEAYEVRTPDRRDARDPLLLGIAEGQWYRVALWGESLRPLEEIEALVQRSLELRRRAFYRRTFSLLMSGAGLLCFIVGVIAMMLFPDASFYRILPKIGALSIILSFLTVGERTSENCQHDFLDRYR